MHNKPSTGIFPTTSDLRWCAHPSTHTKGERMTQNQNEWQDVPTPKATEPDAISRTVGEMALLYRGMKGALYSRKTLRIMRNEFEEVIDLIEQLNDDQRADANALLRSALERGCLLDILRSVLNVRRAKKQGE
jgi:hypothetical protein